MCIRTFPSLLKLKARLLHTQRTFFSSSYQLACCRSQPVYMLIYIVLQILLTVICANYILPQLLKLLFYIELPFFVSAYLLATNQFV
jgi:hypothetical protein